MAKKKTVKMVCGEVEKDLTIEHAERILKNPASSKEWSLHKDVKDYELKDGSIIATTGTGKASKTKEQTGD